MKQLRCEACGAPLVVSEDGLHAKCDYCGSEYVYEEPKSEYWVEQMNEANNLRYNNDFYEAIRKYRVIVEKNPTDPQAYWGLLLSNYGVGYEKDPTTGKFIPTFHRNNRRNILYDDNFKACLKYSNDEQKVIFSRKANELRRIQQGIEERAMQGERFDVFISYKDSDVDQIGKSVKTIDRDIAYNIYEELRRNNIRTFFSEVTLATKASIDYEPVIFNALYSCKVFILVGTTKEHIYSTWVKNEWTRYLERVREDARNGIDPALRSQHFAVVGANMNVDDFPDALFGRTQNIMLEKYAGNSYKFDIVRSVRNILGIKETEQVAKVVEANKALKDNEIMSNNLTMRGDQCVEDGNLRQAKIYYDEALTQHPTNPITWWKMFLIESGLRDGQYIRYYDTCTDINSYNNAMAYNEKAQEKLFNPSLEKAKKYATGEFKARLDAYYQQNLDNYQNAYRQLSNTIYDIGVKLVKKGMVEDGVWYLEYYTKNIAPTNAKGYVALAFGRYGRLYSDPIKLANAPNNIDTAIESIKYNDAIIDMLNGVDYMEAIRLSNNEVATKLDARRVNITTKVNKLNDELVLTVYDKADELMNSGAFEKASMGFSFLADRYVSEDDYNMKAFLASQRATALDELITLLKVDDIAYIFDNKYYIKLMASENADTIKIMNDFTVRLREANEEVIKTHRANLKNAGDKLLQQGNFDEAEKRYREMYSYGDTSKDNLEHIIFAKYKSHNYTTLWANLGEDRKMADNFYLEDGDVANLLASKEITNDFVKEWAKTKKRVYKSVASFERKRRNSIMNVKKKSDRLKSLGGGCSTLLIIFEVFASSAFFALLMTFAIIMQDNGGVSDLPRMFFFTNMVLRFIFNHAKGDIMMAIGYAIGLSFLRFVVMETIFIVTKVLAKKSSKRLYNKWLELTHLAE